MYFSTCGINSSKKGGIASTEIDLNANPRMPSNEPIKNAGPRPPALSTMANV
jgi:hypothetical protein